MNDVSQIVDGEPLVDEFFSQLQSVIHELIAELRSNHRIPVTLHPTKSEQILLMVLKSPEQYLSFDALSVFFSDDADPDHCRDVLIGRLNVKLERYGYKIERPRGYRLTKV